MKELITTIDNIIPDLNELDDYVSTISESYYIFHNKKYIFSELINSVGYIRNQITIDEFSYHNDDEIKSHLNNIDMYLKDINAILLFVQKLSKLEKEEQYLCNALKDFQLLWREITNLLLDCAINPITGF
ncbi:hypothetical protein A9Q68_06920 [Streptococcus bovimastitidis]|uniref:Uncharacterized protein n=1 Tax=Streptococcus bovimastitidis TaxID=1856638 RepID=A0A1L8MLT4_9STRE|nr:hypothetical protein [Streptococcus bovimastitidis]OJF71713.1 hypothetical protein A9Q68_06920 [Streptococcus bovimastitidis]